MASLGKIPVFSGEDYAYWKVRMSLLAEHGSQDLGYYQEPDLRGAFRLGHSSSSD